MYVLFAFSNATGDAVVRLTVLPSHMNYSLNSLKGVIQGITYETSIGVIKGDTWSLDYGSYAHMSYCHIRFSQGPLRMEIGL